MDKRYLKDFNKEERQSFYQSKYDYYKTFMTRLMAISFLTYTFFFITDCLTVGRFSYETLWARLITLIPFVGYVIVIKKSKDYRIAVPVTYIMIHIIIWSTNRIIYIVGGSQFELPGMLIMHLMFVCAGFGSPLPYSIVGNALFLLDIVVAHVLIQYNDFPNMLLFNVPCVIGVCMIHHMLQKVYMEQYLIRQQLEHLVVHDQLTKVNNRNKLKEISNYRGEMVAFSDMAVSMLLMDIDFFKQVNDKFGHEAGDTVLVHLAQTLKESVRVTDYVIRWGGEEFLIILPGCSAEQALIIAEKLRKRVEESDNGICPITISIGVARHLGGDYHATIKKADEALYNAKRAGRNSTALYEENNAKGE